MRKSFVVILLGVIVLVGVFAGMELNRRKQAAVLRAQNESKREPVLTVERRTNIAQPKPATPRISTNEATGLILARNRTNRTAVPNRGGNPNPPVDPLQLESAYRANADEANRYTVIDQLSDQGDLPALQTLDRLFQNENSPDMKVEMLDSLSFYEGFNVYKLQMLSVGTQANQPKEVRQAAIDALLDLDDKSAVPLLQPLRKDPDPEIREAAEDAI